MTFSLEQGVHRCERPDLHLTWTDNLSSSTVVTSAPWTGHSGAGPELSLLPLTPEGFSPDLAIWLSEELMSQDWHRFATPQVCIDDLGSGECEVSIIHWDPSLLQNKLLLTQSGVHPLQPDAQILRETNKYVHDPGLATGNMSQAMVWKLLFSKTEAWIENLTVSELHFHGRVSEKKSRRICRVSLEWLNSENLYLMLVRMWIPHLRVWKL